MPITNVRAPHANVVDRSGSAAEARRRSAGVVTGAQGRRAPDGSRRSGSSTSRPGPPRQDRASRRRRPARRRPRAPGRAPSPGSAAVRRRASGARRRQRAASSAAGIARGQVQAGRDDPCVRPARRPAQRRDDAVHVLVGHRRRHEGERARASRNGRRSSRAAARAAAPAGLCAPSRSTSRPPRQQLQPSRPRRAGVPGPARGGVGAWRCRRPRAHRATASATATFAAW